MPRPFIFALLACALAAAPAGASNFWEQTGAAKPAATDDDKDAKSYDELLAKAEEYTELAEQYRRMWATTARSTTPQPYQMREFQEQAREAAKQAVRYYDKALELRPDEADLHFVCGWMSYSYLYEYYDDRGPTSLRDKIGKHAVDHWDEFERLAPDDPRRVEFTRGISPGWAHPYGTEPMTYQFARSIYYTKLGTAEGYEKALEDYEYLLGAAPRDNRMSDFISRLLTNSAEIHMALGHVEEAIDRYREGLEYNSDALYYYGLAVALDRDGERQSAIETMREAVSRDPNMDKLKQDTVFFIPNGDIAYYYGLAFEALGKNTEALTFFRDYVDRIQDKRYVEHARYHIERLQKRAKETKQRK